MYARDGANNISEGYYTKVTIKDMIAPTLTLNGSDKVDVPLNGTFTDPGATFNDNYDAQKIVYANEKLDTSKVGPQVLTYTATDAAGNKSNTVTRTVTVVGTEKTYELTAPTKTCWTPTSAPSSAPPKSATLPATATGRWAPWSGLFSLCLPLSWASLQAGLMWRAPPCPSPARSRWPI